MTEAIEKLIAAGRWISVDDAIPPLGDYSVLVRFDNGSEETIHVEDYFEDITAGLSEAGEQLYTKWYKTQGVTHWHTLPDDRLAEVAEIEHGAVDSTLHGDIPLLLKAIDAGDPMNEIRIRVEDIQRRMQQALSRANEIATKGEG